MTRHNQPLGMRGEATGPVNSPSSGCTDRTHRGRRCSRGRPYRAGLPQTWQGERSRPLGVVPQLVRTSSEVGVDEGGCSATRAKRGVLARRRGSGREQARRRLPQPRRTGAATKDPRYHDWRGNPRRPMDMHVREATLVTPRDIRSSRRAAGACLRARFGAGLTGPREVGRRRGGRCRSRRPTRPPGCGPVG